MKNTKVVHLAEVRHLLAEWELIRQAILKGNVSGWMGTLQDADGTDTVYLGGVYVEASDQRLQAVLKMSKARLYAEDPALASATR